MTRPPRDAETLPALLRGARCVFMDCDGVIFDSNPLKAQAFRRTLEGWPEEAVERLIRHHRARGGVSRFEKLRTFFETICPVEDPEDRIAAACERFHQLSLAGYAALSPRPEALAFASACLPRPVMVVSGGAQDELREVFARKGIDDRFAGIYGSPEDKVSHMSRALERLGLGPDQAVMIGDGWGDWAACRALGVPFVFLAEMSEWDAAGEHVRGPGCWWIERWDALLGAAGERA